MATVPINRRAVSSEIERPLPHYSIAEKTLLGSLILTGENGENPMLRDVRVKIGPDDFFFPEHKKIFAAMLALDDAQTAIDAVTLTNKLHNLGQLTDFLTPAYISHLADGIPRAMNVAHYAEIIAEKAQMRRMISAAQTIQDLAYDPAMRAGELLERMNQQLQDLAKPRSHNPATIVGIRELMTMDMPPLEFVFEPLLTVGGTGELYGYRGTGKSLIATWMSLRISNGAVLLFPHPHMGGNWPIRRRSRLLYVYGEMHGQMIKTRLWQIARGEGMDRLPEDEWFGVMCKDFQKAWRPNISTPMNRKIIEERIASGGYQVLVLDNISTLWPSSQEGEGERSAVLNDWFNDLNQAGVSVIFLHHAGKAGTQRGSSEKEDMLDFVIRLQRPVNKKNEPNLCVAVDIEKMRAECKEARWVKPFELSLDTAEDIATWKIRPARNAQIEAAFEMFRDGMKPADVFAELGIGRSTAFRYKKLFDQNPDPKAWTSFD